MVKFFGPNSFLPKVDFCCCGCSLKTGTLIIAWISIIFCFIGATDKLSSLSEVINGDLDQVFGTGHGVWKIVYAINMSDEILTTVAGVLLVFAVQSGRHKYCLPFLIVLVVTTILTPIVWFLSLTSVDPYLDLSDKRKTVHGIFSVIILPLLNMYSLLIVNSYYTELIRSSDGLMGTV